jgi:hypothetical protein
MISLQYRLQAAVGTVPYHTVPSKAMLRIRDFYFGSWLFLSRIPDLEQKKEGEIFVLLVFATINFPKYKVILHLKRYRKKLSKLA